MSPELISTLSLLSGELIAQGATAVALTGSHARGDAVPESDVDLIALGDGPAYQLQQHAGVLIAVAWRSVAECRAAFLDPSQVGSVITGWREAILLRDPAGLAAALQDEARNWRWLALSDAADRWVAEALTGYAGEAHKLAGSINAGRWWTAAIQRSLLALHLAPILAVNERILYSSENHLWQLVADALGEPWRLTQSAALGLGGESLSESCRAALALYALAAARVRSLLDVRQDAVVVRACVLAGHPLDER